MNYRTKKRQRDIGLSSCADQGTVYWSRANGLVFGVVAGMVATGEKVLIANSPLSRSFELTPMSDNKDGRWFLDPENKDLDHLDILDRAFTNLNTYGVDSSERYAPDYRFEFTTLSKKNPSQKFDDGFIKILGRLLMVKEAKVGIGQMVKRLFSLPKKTVSRVSNRVETKSKQRSI